MAAYLRDLANTCIMYSPALPQVITASITGTTGAAGNNFIAGDGLCNMIAEFKCTSLTAVTAQVQQSTLTNSGYTDIAGAYVTATTDGTTAVAFQRDKQYLSAYVVFSGTTATVAVQLLEQYKVIPGT